MVVLILFAKIFPESFVKIYSFFVVANFRVNTGNAVKKKFAQLHGIFVGKGGTVFIFLVTHM